MMLGAGYGMMGIGEWFWMSIIWLFWVALIAFVFAVVFWWTYKLLINGNKIKINKKNKNK